jgi:hypothetical protein
MAKNRLVDLTAAIKTSNGALRVIINRNQPNGPEMGSQESAWHYQQSKET